MVHAHVPIKPSDCPDCEALFDQTRQWTETRTRLQRVREMCERRYDGADGDAYYDPSGEFAIEIMKVLEDMRDYPDNLTTRGN